MSRALDPEALNTQGVATINQKPASQVLSTLKSSLKYVEDSLQELIIGFFNIEVRLIVLIPTSLSSRISIQRMIVVLHSIDRPSWSPP